MAAGSFRGPVDVYWANNMIVSATVRNELTGNYTCIDARPFWPSGLIPLPPGEIRKSVLENAGAFPWDRDDIDKRIIEGVKNGIGKIINSESEVGGYPSYKSVFRKFNPEEWDLKTMMIKLP
jgi:hypothetical protein